MLDILKKDSTSRSVSLRIIDSTDGTPETGVAYNTSGLALWYRREGGAKVSITAATLGALTTGWTSGGFLHVSDGEYRLDVPDAAFATGANYVDIGGTVTGMIVIGGRVRLVNVDLEDTVRAGLTALPNAAAAAPDGLFTRGTGAGQINQSANGQIDVNVAAMANNVMTAAAAASDLTTELQSGLAAATAVAAVSAAVSAVSTAITAVQADTDDIQSRLPAALVSGRIDASVGAMANNVVTAAAIASSALTLAKIASDLQLSLGVIATGTAASISATSITLASGHGVTGKALIVLTGGTAAKGKSRFITPASGDTFDVDPAWNDASTGESTPSGTITYVVVPAPPAAVDEPVVANIVAVSGTDVTAQAGENFNAFFDNGNADTLKVVDDVGSGTSGGSGPTAAEIRSAVGLASANLDTQLAAIQADTDNIQTRLPAALVSGRIDASVGAMANNVVTAAAAASDLTTELQSGLATASALSAVEAEIAAIKAKTDNLPASPAATSDVPGATAVASAVLSAVIEGSITFAQSVRLMNAVLAGKLSGAETSSVAIRDLADSKDRVSATVDADGNRTAVTLDLS